MLQAALAATPCWINCEWPKAVLMCSGSVAKTLCRMRVATLDRCRPSLAA